MPLMRPADRAVVAQNKAFYEFLVPIVKGFATEMSIEVASLGVQVHGGMGFIEETGAAQYYRDARILTIYEGTTAIQANDLVGRKTARDGGETAMGIIERGPQDAGGVAGVGGRDCNRIGQRLALGLDALEDAVDFMVAHARSRRACRAMPAACRTSCWPAPCCAAGRWAGQPWSRTARLAGWRADPAFLSCEARHRPLLRRSHPVASAGGYRDSIVDGAAGVLALEIDQF